MSTFEHIFLKTDTSASSAAETIANVLDMEAVQNNDEVGIRGDGIDNIPGHIRGTLGANIYSTINDPDESSIFDYHQLVWKMWRANSDEETQLAAARTIFLKLINNLDWPTILVHDIDILIAAWSPERGLREFPPGTALDDTDINTWGE